MMVIGITGGIASGKSTIARIMAEHGFPHLDADHLVHELMRRPDIAEKIAVEFPGTVHQGIVNRKALGLEVAKHSLELARLEAILHPAVRAVEEAAIQQARAEGKRAVILDIPLLFETGAEKICDKVIAAYAPLETRRERALARGMPRATIDRLIARQMTDEARNARADIVIDTSVALTETRRVVEALLAQWKLV